MEIENKLVTNFRLNLRNSNRARSPVKLFHIAPDTVTILRKRTPTPPGWRLKCVENLNFYVYEPDPNFPSQLSSIYLNQTGYRTNIPWHIPTVYSSREKTNLFCLEPHYQIINNKKQPLSLETWCRKVIQVNKISQDPLPRWLRQK